MDTCTQTHIHAQSDMVLSSVSWKCSCLCWTLLLPFPLLPHPSASYSDLSGGLYSVPPGPNAGTKAFSGVTGGEGKGGGDSQKEGGKEAELCKAFRDIHLQLPFVNPTLEAVGAW